jgi:hypothetical protein
MSDEFNKTKWHVFLLIFVLGIILGGIGGFMVARQKFNHLADEASQQWDLQCEYYSLESKARVTLQALKAMDRGTTNHFKNFREHGCSTLSNYLHLVEKLEAQNPEWYLGNPPTYPVVREYLSPFSFNEAEAEFFWGKMIPLAQEFIRRNNLPYDSKLGTNNIKHYRVELFRKRPGGTGSFRLENGYTFSFLSDGQAAEVSNFSDNGVKLPYSLVDAPKEEIEAVQALNLSNKLNDGTALELAKIYFGLQGHKETNFQPAELNQETWYGGDDNLENRFLPFYTIEWHRKDVKQEDRDNGNITMCPWVEIGISGITSNLIHYSKGYMPVGSDF